MTDDRVHARVRLFAAEMRERERVMHRPAGTMTLACEDITPERAVAMLHGFTRDDLIRPASADPIAADIRAGRWDPLRRPFVVGRDGHVVVGHMRLCAIAEAGVTVTAWVIHDPGCVAETFPVDTAQYWPRCAARRDCHATGQRAGTWCQCQRRPGSAGLSRVGRLALDRSRPTRAPIDRERISARQLARDAAILAQRNTEAVHAATLADARAAHRARDFDELYARFEAANR